MTDDKIKIELNIDMTDVEKKIRRLHNTIENISRLNADIFRDQLLNDRALFIDQPDYYFTTENSEGKQETREFLTGNKIEVPDKKKRQLELDES